MIDLIELFTFKLMDTVIQSLKNILMIKGKAFWSAFASAVSYLFFILLMKRLTSATSNMDIIATLASVFLGQYITQYFSDKLEKDRVWKISITPHSIDEGQAIADKLKQSNIPVQTSFCNTKDEVEVLAVTAFSQTKAQSVLASAVLAEYPTAKFDIVEIKNRF